MGKKKEKIREKSKGSPIKCRWQGSRRSEWLFFIPLINAQNLTSTPAPHNKATKSSEFWFQVSAGNTLSFLASFQVLCAHRTVIYNFEARTFLSFAPPPLCAIIYDFLASEWEPVTWRMMWFHSSAWDYFNMSHWGPIWWLLRQAFLERMSAFSPMTTPEGYPRAGWLLLRYCTCFNKAPGPAGSCSY